MAIVMYASPFVVYIGLEDVSPQAVYSVYLAPISNGR